MRECVRADDGKIITEGAYATHTVYIIVIIITNIIIIIIVHDEYIHSRSIKAYFTRNNAHTRTNIYIIDL